MQGNTLVLQIQNIILENEILSNFTQCRINIYYQLYSEVFRL